MKVGPNLTIIRKAKRPRNKYTGKKSYVVRGGNWSDGLTKQELRAISEAKKWAESRLFPLENSRESMPTPRFQISSIQKERINVFCF